MKEDDKTEILKLILKLEARLRNFNIKPQTSSASLGARSAVDVLTDDGIAETLEEIKARLDCRERKSGRIICHDK
jgi:hypothetical protein